MRMRAILATIPHPANVFAGSSSGSARRRCSRRLWDTQAARVKAARSHRSIYRPNRVCAQADEGADGPVGGTNSIFTPRLRIRGAVRRAGRAAGPEPYRGSLWAEDRVRGRDPAVAGRALGVDAAG